jgi:hypothetical protein
MITLCYVYTLFLLIILYHHSQANDRFWKVQYDHEAAKQARAVKRAERKTAKTGTSKKKKPSASEMFQLDDSDDNEEEVTFNFPYSLIIILLTLFPFQEDTGNSQPVEEVTIISSDSEPFPRQKTRRVTRKVRFSHPLAYQDPQFLLKRQQFESRRQTRTSKDAELSSGLPDATRKRRTEVIPDLYPVLPLAGLIRQPLNSSDSNYQDTSPSSGESMQSNMPAFKTAPG